MVNLENCYFNMYSDSKHNLLESICSFVELRDKLLELETNCTHDGVKHITSALEDIRNVKLSGEGILFLVNLYEKVDKFVVVCENGNEIKIKEISHLAFDELKSDVVADLEGEIEEELSKNKEKESTGETVADLKSEIKNIESQVEGKDIVEDGEVVNLKKEINSSRFKQYSNTKLKKCNADSVRESINSVKIIPFNAVGIELMELFLNAGGYNKRSSEKYPFIVRFRLCKKYFNPKTQKKLKGRL